VDSSFDEVDVINSGKVDVDRVERVVLRNGNARWISSTRAPIRDGRSAITGLMVIARDITRRKRIEEESRIAGQRLKQVLDLAGEAIIALDDKLRIIVFNQQAEEPSATLQRRHWVSISYAAAATRDRAAQSQRPRISQFA